MTMLTVGDLTVELRGTSRRTTLQLTIERDGELIVLAPAGCETSTVEEFVREKRPWIYRRLAEKEAAMAPMAAKKYVSGEGLPYLGRNYRLLLVEDQDRPVKLTEGRFKMRKSVSSNGRDHMVAWYTERARAWLGDKAQPIAGRVGASPTRIAVRDLGYRWGSCAKDGSVYFHWRSILLPPRVVEYVIAHELVHLREPLHSPEFWLGMERAMPDFQKRKEWLAVNGKLVEAI